jgi:hypothetical protein
MSEREREGSEFNSTTHTPIHFLGESDNLVKQLFGPHYICMYVSS